MIGRAGTLEKGVNRNGQGRKKKKKRDPEHFDQIMGERKHETKNRHQEEGKQKKKISDPQEPVSRKYRILVDLFKSMQACELKKRLATHTSSSPGPPRSYRAHTTQPRPSPEAYKEPGGATTGLTAVTACMGTQMMGTKDGDPTGRVVAFGAGGGARFGLLGLSGRPN